MLKKFNDSIFCTLLLVILSLQFYAIESGADTFYRTYSDTGNEFGRSIDKTKDGGYIIVGETIPETDLIIIKTDQSLNEEWRKKFDEGENEGEGAWSVKQTPDNGYIVTGYCNNWENIYLLKTDEEGNKLWSKILGGDKTDSGYSVILDEDDGYIITGVINDQQDSTGDIFLIKTDSSGNVLWQQNYDNGGYEQGTDVKKTLDGGFIISGFTAYYYVGAGSYDIFIVKTDKLGNMEWSKVIGSEDYYETAHSVIQSEDGGYIVVGSTNGIGVYNIGPSEIMVVRIDSAGNLEWKKNYESNKPEHGMYIIQAPQNGYIISGHTGREDAYWSGGDVVFYNIDEDGKVRWSKYISVGDYAGSYSMVHAHHEGLLGVGACISQDTIQVDIAGIYYKHMSKNSSMNLPFIPLLLGE
jgi:hypothetical protein